MAGIGTNVLIDRCLIGCVQFYSNRESGLVSAVTQWFVVRTSVCYRAVTQWFVVYSIKQDSLNQD